MGPFRAIRNYVLECLLWALLLMILFRIGREMYTFPRSYLGFTASALWPLGGICSALLIIRGWKFFPAVFLGRMLSIDQLWFGHPLAIIPWSHPYSQNDYWVHPLAYTMESLTVWVLFVRIMRLSTTLGTLKDLLIFMGIVAPLASFTFPCIASLAVTNFFSFLPEQFVLRSLLSWSGNFLGLLAFVPAILSFQQTHSWSFRAQLIPKVLWFLALGATLLPLCQKFEVSTSYPLAFLPFPVLIGIALNAGFFATALAGAIITLVLCRLSILELGPFVVGNHPIDAFLEVTMYVGLLSITSLIMARVTDERSEIQEKKNLMISTTGIALWEWTKDKGVVLIDQFLDLFPGNKGMEHSIPDPAWQEHLSVSDFSKLPWVELSRSAKKDTPLTVLHFLAPGAAPRALEFTSQVTGTDTRGKPAVMLGTIRDVTDREHQEERNMIAFRQSMELENLRSKLNPHFLFNSLNLLKSLITDDPANARKAVVALSDLLRASLRKGNNSPLSPLSSEISLCRSYLELQQLRFGKRLEAVVEIRPGVPLHLPIPAMMITQLVENGIKHGVEPSVRGGQILLSISRVGSQLLIRVASPGEYQPEKPDGIGLSFLKNQLAHHYGSNATFQIGNRSEHTVVAEIHLPCSEGAPLLVDGTAASG